MIWTGTREFKAQLVKLWERGDLLRCAVSDQSIFPLKLMVKGPSSADITDRFDLVRAWVAELATANYLRVEFEAVRHRVQGAQHLPSSVWIDTIDDVLSWLGKRREWARFEAIVLVTRQTHPTLLPWLEKRPLQALALVEQWPQLLAVVSWLIKQPRPGIYLRQVDLPGIHTKFIEAHRGVLSDLLDLALPAEAVAVSKTGINQFAGRYGFLDKPTRIRFRVLDPEVLLIPGAEYPDISLDAETFSLLSIKIKRVFITENEINFLAFPRVKSALVIFGSGYGWDALAKSQWLHDCACYYWGDIDTHGFAILNQLRGAFPHVSSLMMDRPTLIAHEAFWAVEDKPTRADLPLLTAKERSLYDELRDNRIRLGLRLEQELIKFGWVNQAVQDLLTEPS